MGLLDNKHITKLVDFFKSNSSKNKISKDRIISLIQYQCEELSTIYKILTSIEPKNMDEFEKIYNDIKFDSKNRDDVSFIIPYLKKKYSFKIQSYEKKHLFFAQAKIAETILKLHKENLKNFKVIMEEDEIILEDSKVSLTIFFGFLHEVNLFIKYTNFLYSHFAKSITSLELYPIRYQAEYLQKNVEPYVNFVNSVIIKEATSFVTEIQRLKKNQKDYFLQKGSNFFTSFLRENDLDVTNKSYLIKGISGFNIVGRMLETWDEYQHTKYLERKATKEWLENQQALLLMQIQGISKDDPEYVRLEKIIKSYEDKIAYYERKIKEYEEEF